MKLHIAEMLRAQKGEHLSFHTPGHKRPGADITELSYSDNLYAPSGVIARAEEDVAKILGAARSFLLTDGSTAGVYSMLYALRSADVRSLAAPRFSHPCVLHACEVLGLEYVPIEQETRCGIPVQPSEAAMECALKNADALLLTSPDYYGFFALLEAARALCDGQKKPLAVDGAHGSHLHFTRRHAGKFADMWVDGVHKSLPALTQGAVVSAKGEWAERLHEGVLRCRTTSPSYPIMASVEYAVKYPRNEKIEALSEAFKRRHGCVENDDWTKILLPCGARCAAANAFFEQNGVYPEFADGNYIMFYLSPCTKESELQRLSALVDFFGRGAVKSEAPAGSIPIYSEKR